MKFSFPVYRRMLLIYAALVVIVALVLAVGVIGPVKAEAAAGATPERAVHAFWVNIGINLLSAITLGLLAIRSKGRGWISTSVHIITGLVIMFLSIALADAASAYQSHGPAMQTATVLLFLCAAADFLTGALVFTTAFLQPEKS